MELASRQPGDVLLPAGECRDIRRRLRPLARQHALTTVVASAFDFRTRILPFYYSCTHMAPAGARAVGSSLLDAGFERTRIVLGQWNRRFRPSRMQLDGQTPDLLCVSSMQIHGQVCEDWIRDACRIEPDRRPLIVAGGPKVIYEPWTVFGTDPGQPWAADVAVTGEDYVLMNLIEVVLSIKGRNESLRSAYLRSRDEGLLDAVPGLVYSRTDSQGRPEQLVDTGIQRVVGDLDELADPVLGYGILESPSRKATLAARPLEAGRVHKYGPIGSMVFTTGCKFVCPYCPIPAYNQRQHRVKSGQQIADEMTRLHKTYGLRYFFGTDDNFFNDIPRTVEICETLAAATIDGKPLRQSVRWGTEVTVHDTVRMKDHLHTVRKAGAIAMWLGVEDITATFVKKGQSVDRTSEAFNLLHKEGIAAVPMLMHHEGQPLVSRKGHYGLLNQVKLLRKVNAVDVQILCMTPAPGSKLYESAFTSGLVIRRAGGKNVQPHMNDGNFVTANERDKPWKMQMRVALALMYIYNPYRLIEVMFRPKSPRMLMDMALISTGMLGLIPTLPRMIGWSLRLALGKVHRRRDVPASPLPMTSPTGEVASHDICPSRRCAMAAEAEASGSAEGSARTGEPAVQAG